MRRALLAFALVALAGCGGAAGGGDTNDHATVFAAEDSVIALLPIDNEPEVRELLMGSVE